MCNKENREYKHQHKERLCYCCDTLQNNEEDITKLELNIRGYGSIYDGVNSYIQLCPKCLKPEYIAWFDEAPNIVDDYCEEYNFEDNIEQLVNSFPLENQEYFKNSNCEHWLSSNEENMDRQDWLDMMNGIMTDEKYKKYKMHSPSEIKAYQEKFPTCEHPINIIYNDGSKGCSCLYGACGKFGQNVGKNIWDECYKCKQYKLRESPLQTIPHNEYEKLEKEMFGETSQEKFNRLLKEHVNDFKSQ